MPVSGSEERGVNPVAWHSSDSVAGIPIKKRRFPLDILASTPAQDESRESVEKDLLKKEPSMTLNKSTIIDNTGISTSSSRISLTKESAYVGESREVQGISKLPSVKIKEPSRISSGSLDGTERKHVLAEKTASQLDLGHMELQVAKKEAVALERGEGPKEHLFQTLAGENIDKPHQMLKKLEHISLSLSLSKGKNSAQCQSDSVESKSNDSDLSANRIKWDLNTTMDEWEDSESDATAGEGAVNDTSFSGSMHVQQPLKCLTRKVECGVSQESQRDAEHRSNISISSMLPTQQHKSDNSLNFCNSPSYLELSPSQGQSSSSVSVNTGSFSLKTSMPLPLPLPLPLAVPANCNSVGADHSIVKSEPIDESINRDITGNDEFFKALSDGRNLKHELVDICTPLKLVNSSTLTVVDSRPIKSELLGVGEKEPIYPIGVKSDLSQKHSELSITNTKLPPSGISSFSKVLVDSGVVTNCSDRSTYLQHGICGEEVPREANERVLLTASEMVSTCGSQEVKGTNVFDSNIDTKGNLDVTVDKSIELCTNNSMAKPLLKRGNGDGSVSDEEKINISADMLEDDSYSSDYNSDGNHNLEATTGIECGGEDDDYEDGEVREPLVNAATESLIVEQRDANNRCGGDIYDEKMEILELAGDDYITSNAEEKSDIIENPDKRILDHCAEPVEEVLDEKMDQNIHNNASFQESMKTETLTIGIDKEMLTVKIAPVMLIDQSRKKDIIPQGCETEKSLNEAIMESQVAIVKHNQGEEETTKVTNPVEKNIVELPTVEKSLNVNDVAKSSSSPGNRSRIINLKAANVTSSSCKTRSIPGTETSFPSRTGRDRYADSGLEGGKFYHPRGREVYNESSHKFSRDRNRDQPFRNSRMNYSRGSRGGRSSSRLNSNFSDWNDDHDIPPEVYNDSTRFRIRRQRHTPDGAEAELECDTYIDGLDDHPVGGPGRGRRKLTLNDEMPKFRNFSLRRRSPVSHRVHQMVSRPPRTFSSPSGCIGEDGSSDIVGLRASDKFTRDVDDNMVEPMFTRSQPYNASDGPFTRGSRNFGSIQSRALPRIRSKSPTRTGAHSPGQWSSPRRGSPDVFDGHQGLTRRRSTTIYRSTDRLIRSPDRSCFHTDMVSRRHNSPSYLDSRHDYVTTQRSLVCNRRSSSSRAVPRNNPRFDILDPRERTDHADEYFGSPIRATRFHDLGNGEGNGDERRRAAAERRRSARSFRPPNNDTEGENFHYNGEDGPTRPPYRFCPEEDSEFSERSNLREREFDRRIKNRPGHAPPPRRIRGGGTDDQEGNYRASEQVWHDEEFEDVTVKRRRF